MAITVTSTEDSLSPSDPMTVTLRQAIAAAQVGDTIDFSDNLTGEGNVVDFVLTLGELRIDKSLTILGRIDPDDPDAPQRIRITAPGSRVFNIDDGASGQSSVTLFGLSLTGANLNGDGGAIFNEEDLELQQSLISGSVADHGGAIYNRFGNLEISYSMISGNTANAAFRGGGGILNRAGTVSISQTTVSGNRASDGGGVLNDDGQLTIFASTISGNTAADSGGGVYNVAGSATIELSTMSGNTAGDSGGGVYNWNASTGDVDINSSTITNNTARRGGGVAANASLGSGRLTARASIIAGNSNSDMATVGLYHSAPQYFQSEGFNLIGMGNGVGSFQNNDRINVADPGLIPLANNGGPTATHALAPASLAIDAIPATPEGFAYDQRGYLNPRTWNERTDIGAYEYRDDSYPYVEPPGAFLPGDFDGSGAVDGADLTGAGQGFVQRFGADLDGSDFLVWQRNLGAVAAASASASSIATVEQANRANFVEQPSEPQAAHRPFLPVVGPTVLVDARRAAGRSLLVRRRLADDFQATNQRPASEPGDGRQTSESQVVQSELPTETSRDQAIDVLYGTLWRRLTDSQHDAGVEGYMPEPSRLL